MTAVAANGLPTLRAIPLFRTPIKGIPLPAKTDQAAKTKYERISGAPTAGWNGRYRAWRLIVSQSSPKQAALFVTCRLFLKLGLMDLLAVHVQNIDAWASFASRSGKK
jgi:hypothetical protein